MDVSEFILKIIKKIKNKEDIQINDEFRKIGINSVQYVQIIVNIETNLGVALSDELLILDENMSIEQLAKKVTKTING